MDWISDFQGGRIVPPSASSFELCRRLGTLLSGLSLQIRRSAGVQADPNRLARDLGMQVVNPAPMLHQFLSSLRPTGFLRVRGPAILAGKSAALNLVVTVGKSLEKIEQF